MTPEQARWVRAHRETFERALQKAEQEQREMLALAARLAAGPMREAWENKLVTMAERLRRQRAVWEGAVAEEGARP